MLIASCATPLPPAMDDVSLPDVWRTPQFVVHDENEAALPHQSWWHALEDAGLNALVKTALEQNLDIAHAHKRLSEARVLGERAGSRFLPSLGLRMNGARDASAKDTYLQFGAESIWDLSWPIERQALGRQAQASIVSAHAQWRMAQNDIAAAVVHTYTQLRQVQAELKILETVKKADARVLRYAQVRRALSLGTDHLIEEAIAQGQQHDMRIVDLTLSQDDLAQALAILLGQAQPDATWFVAGAQPELKRPAFDRLPTSLLTTRPDIAMARADVLSAAAQAGIAQSRLYPRLVLVSSWIYAKNLTNRGANNADSVPMVAPFIDVPLWDWGARASVRDARNIALEAAVIQYRKTVIDGYAQAESALAALHAADQWAVHADARVKAAEKVAGVKRELVRIGLLDATSTLNEARECVQARIEQSQARARRVVAFTALYKSLGAGLPDASLEEDSH